MWTWIKQSAFAQVIAQAAIAFGALDASGVIPLLPPKIGAAIAVVGGIVAGINKALGADAPRTPHTP